MTVNDKFRHITEKLIEKGLTVSTMESCTSGLIASLITDTEGSSAVMKGAFVTYSNEAKVRNGVPQEVIETYGVYSGETAAHMALACQRFYGADIGIGITGSFSNVDPANPGSIPGVVYFSIVCAGLSPQNYIITGVSKESRLESKLKAADSVADELLKIL